MTKKQYIPQACVCLQGNMLIGVKSTSKVSIREDFKDRRHWHVWLFSMSFLVFCPWQKCTTSILHIIDMDVLQRQDRYKTRLTTMLLYKIIFQKLVFLKCWFPIQKKHVFPHVFSQVWQPESQLCWRFLKKNRLAKVRRRGFMISWESKGDPPNATTPPPQEIAGLNSRPY